ncbi:PIF1-like helicase-domain-containing protein, partial [Mycena polygramma]
MGYDNPAEDEVFDYGLFLIDKLLRESNRMLKDWPTMPLPQKDWDAEVVNPLIAEQLDYNRGLERERAEQKTALLNPEQRQAFDKIIDSVHNRSGKVYFVNGPGGTGKTFVYNTVCHRLRSEENIVLCVASSGIAALLMPGGRTAHSVFKIPIDGLNSESFCNIPKNSQRADLLRRTNLII